MTATLCTMRASNFKRKSDLLVVPRDGEDLCCGTWSLAPPPPPPRHNCQRRVAQSVHNLWELAAHRAPHTFYSVFNPFFFLNEFRKQNRRLETRHISDTESGKQHQKTLRHKCRGRESGIYTTLTETSLGSQPPREDSNFTHLPTQTEHIVVALTPPPPVY